MTEKGLIESMDRIRATQRVNSLRIITIVSVIKKYTSCNSPAYLSTNTDTADSYHATDTFISDTRATIYKRIND